MKISLKDKKGKKNIEKSHYTRNKIISYIYPKNTIYKKKIIIFFTKIILYFELYIPAKSQNFQHIKKIIISHFFHIKKKPLFFRNFCFKRFIFNFI